MQIVKGNNKGEVGVVVGTVGHGYYEVRLPDGNVLRRQYNSLAIQGEQPQQQSQPQLKQSRGKKRGRPKLPVPQLRHKKTKQLEATQLQQQPQQPQPLVHVQCFKGARVDMLAQLAAWPTCH